MRLGDVFYFSSLCIEGLWSKTFFNCVLGGGGGSKENKERSKGSRGILCTKQKDCFLKNNFDMINDSAKGQDLYVPF